jgi:mRNA interferase MazF
VGPFATRQVVLLSFPFSDLAASKLRPALVMAEAGKGDWVLCQITSNAYADSNAIPLLETDFSDGGLRRISFARASKLFTAHESLFQRAVGQLTTPKHLQVVQCIVGLLQNSVDEA